jgi:hypothetical protein
LCFRAENIGKSLVTSEHFLLKVDENWTKTMAIQTVLQLKPKLKHEALMLPNKKNPIVWNPGAEVANDFAVDCIKACKFLHQDYLSE